MLLNLAIRFIGAVSVGMALLIYCVNAVALDDISELSFEELMDLEVTSVSKKNQKLSESATAIHVITSENIKRSGVTNIADALRMVPGLQVTRIDSNKWAVSAGGLMAVLQTKYWC